MDNLLVPAHYIQGHQISWTKVPKTDELRHYGWIALLDGFQLEVFIEMEADVKIWSQFPHIFEPGIVRQKERIGFVCVPHSINIQANLNDEWFISNHQHIRGGGHQIPNCIGGTRVSKQGKLMQSLACQALHITPVLSSRGAQCGNLCSNAWDIESTPVGTVSKVSGAIRGL